MTGRKFVWIAGMAGLCLGLMVGPGSNGQALAEGERTPCTGHGMTSHGSVLAPPEIDVAVRVSVGESEPVDLNMDEEADLGFVCPGKEISFRVRAFDIDRHVCLNPLGITNVYNYIQNTSVSVQVQGPDSQETVPLSSSDGSPATTRTWKGAWTVPAGATNEWTFEFQGEVADVECQTFIGGQNHSGSKDSDVDLSYYHGKLTVLQLEIETEEPGNLICVGGTWSYAAKVTPETEGEYVWSVNNADKLGFVDGNRTAQTIAVTGLVASAAENAEELTVEFTPSGASFTCTATTNLTILKVDLGVDTNMDGNPDNDDAQKMEMKGVIINVNNDSDGGGIDCHDGIINGPADKDDMEPLILRKMVATPAKLVLKVDDNTKLRIFDDTDTAIIGPPAADGGPDADEYEVPLASITANDLTYLVECINHGHVIASLIAYDSNNNEICRDEVRLVCNVDRTPSGDQARFWAGSQTQQSDLWGVRAVITAAEPKLNWAPTSRLRKDSASLVWVSAQKNDNSRWMQTGFVTWRVTSGSAGSGIYMEVRFGTGTSGRYRIYKPINPGGSEQQAWPSSGGTCGIAISDASTGRIICWLGNTVWGVFSNSTFITDRMENYQVSTEIFQSVDQMVGTASDKAAVSDIKIKVGETWQDSAIGADDVFIIDRDKYGNPFKTSTSDEWGVSDITATGFKVWDKVVEY